MELGKKKRKKKPMIPRECKAPEEEQDVSSTMTQSGKPKMTPNSDWPLALSNSSFGPLKDVQLDGLSVARAPLSPELFPITYFLSSF